MGGGVAHAALIGSSSGTFSNISSCNGNNAICVVSPANTLTWYRDNAAGGPGTQSVLTADALSFNSPGSLTGTPVNIAELTWASGTTNLSPGFDYALSISITAPDGETLSQSFDLTVIAGGGGIKGFDLNDLSGLALTFSNGDKLTDLHYTVDGGGTLVNIGSNANPKYRWDLANNATSDLFITGDFVTVPEPDSLAIFGSALLVAAGFASRRRTKKS
jgi:hypothetical protein